MGTHNALGMVAPDSRNTDSITYPHKDNMTTMTQSEKQILRGVIAVLKATLENMEARKADEVVAAAIKILESL
jgi:DNA recombination-dependent growth factor C